MLLGKIRELLVSIRVSKGLDPLLVVDVADPLQEEQGKDVGLEVGGIDWPAEDVGSIPEPGLDGTFRNCRETHDPLPRPIPLTSDVDSTQRP